VKMNDLKLHYDMLDSDYFAMPAASNSLLSELKKSPAHLQAALASSPEPTPAMRLGTAFHVATLEEAKFSEYWGRGSELSGRTKEGKSAKKELEMRYAPDKILKPADYDTVCSMRDSVMRHSIAGELLEGVETEVAAIWTDEATGISCKAKIDGLPGDNDCLIDLKSTLDASPEAMAKAIYNFGYYRQGSWYTSPFDDRDRFIIIACEKKAPFAVAVYEVSRAALAQGHSEVQGLLERWADCIEMFGHDGEWPGYDEIVYSLDLPVWAQR